MIYKLVSKLPQYYLARKFNLKVPLPVSYTMALTYNCNAKCKTCRIYDKPRIDQMKVEEWKQIFQNIGNSPYWVTATGGEPFLYKDIVEWYYYLVKYCQPAIVNIPTNGQLHDKILDNVWQMLKLSDKTKLIVNVSLDHYDSKVNDEIRGISGYYQQAIETIKALQQHKGLTVGIHTVISKNNINDINVISRILSSLLIDPTHYITEIAEKRVELGTKDLDITPDNDEYKNAIRILKFFAEDQPKTLIKAFRMNYYDSAIRWNYDRSHIPCYAGYASCQITPDGEIWNCCIQSKSLGNLRKADYDFKWLWNQVSAQMIRQEVKKCVGCTLANSFYTNSLMDIPTLIKVVKELL